METQLLDLKLLFKKMPILKNIDLGLCVSCKATQLLCKVGYCPLMKALDLYPDQTPQLSNLSKDGSIFGPTHQIFVGSQGYPRVHVGPMTSLDPSNNAELQSNPADWTTMNFKEIIDLRFGLLRGMRSTYIRPDKNGFDAKIQEKLQELSLSTNVVEVEGKINGITSFDFKITPESQPMGPSGIMQNFEVTSNPRIPKKVDSIINDELKAKDQLFELYQSNFDVYYLQGIMASGSTGMSDKKRITPTRWSITAVDDTLGKELIPQLKHFPEVTQIEMYRNMLLGNYYTIILLPGNYTFENVEAWIPGNIFSLTSNEYEISVENEGFNPKESYKGKIGYAKQAGGYYATRLAILESLIQRRKRAQVLVLREITPEYLVPVGVWQVREGVRKTIQSKPILFNDKNEVIEYLTGKMHSDPRKYIYRTKTFTQTTLADFF